MRLRALGRTGSGDPVLVDRATELGRVLFSRDRDLLKEGVQQRRGVRFSGIIFAHQLAAGIGKCVEDLELLARARDPAELLDKIVYVPLR